MHSHFSNGGGSSTRNAAPGTQVQGSSASSYSSRGNGSSKQAYSHSSSGDGSSKRTRWRARENSVGSYSSNGYRSSIARLSGAAHLGVVR